MRRVFDLLFGCAHPNYTFPRRSDRFHTGHYVACLHCGNDLAYDWQRMRVVANRVADGIEWERPVPQRLKPAEKSAADGTAEAAPAAVMVPDRRWPC